jgi:RHS repeat-associated protein
MKSISLTAADLSGATKITCTLTGTSPTVGSVAVNSTYMASHTQGAADANDTLILENGILSVTTPNNTYTLEGNLLRIESQRLNGTLAANAWVYPQQPMKTVEFKYNAAGLRVQKKVTEIAGTVTTDYTLNGKQLAALKRGSDTLHFLYDAQARPTEVKYKSAWYAYIYNLQGDVVGILNSSGTLVVEYKYDAWGRQIGVSGSQASTLGEINPFRYRGYVYDEETELYYLRSRYYNPATGRFVNADCDGGRIGVLFSHSSYVYCANAPIDQADPNGKSGSSVTTMEEVMRTLINTICQKEHAANRGIFSMGVIEKDILITTKEEEAHNDIVSIVNSIFAFIVGAAVSGPILATKVGSAIAGSLIGGLSLDMLSNSIQDDRTDRYTVRAGTYTRIPCSYIVRSEFFGFMSVIAEMHSYELRLYPDYCEVWYSFTNYDHTITVPNEKIGRMTYDELFEAFQQ